MDASSDSPSSPPLSPPPSPLEWTPEQDKALEVALAEDEEDDPDGAELDYWERIAAFIPGKEDAVDDVKKHYELLKADVGAIESGLIPLPPYTFLPPTFSPSPTATQPARKGDPDSSKPKADNGHSPFTPGCSFNTKASSKQSDQERRKGIPWTEDEHRMFLVGLEKFGKGDWRSISRNFVVSRTPTQVASHAQKYFIRLNSRNKERRRTSIHDITSIGKNEANKSSGQGNGGCMGVGSAPVLGQGSLVPAGVVYPPGTSIGLPMVVPTGPTGPAVGTPYLLPGGPYLARGPPLIQPAVPGAPVNGVPVAYPIPPPPPATTEEPSVQT